MIAPILNRTASALTLAVALAAAPALAQDAPAAAPPLVIQPAPAPVPQAAAPAPAPQVVAPPPVAAAPIVEEAPAPVARTTRSTTTRSTATRSVTRTTPVAAAPAPEPVAALAEPTPESVAAAPVEEVAPAPAAPVAADTAKTTQSSSTPIWPFAALAALIVAIGAFFILRNRRRDEEEVYYEESVVAPAYVEPVADEAVIVAPGVVAAEYAHDAPIEEHADLARADADEVAALASSDAPAGRPWIELSFRPVRAGATDESATVDVELTIGNAGDVAAEDVHVSTFMLGDQSDAPTGMEGLLATQHTSTEVDAGDIEPGQGSRIDATLSVPRDTMSGATFSPVVVADVRYRLPNGEEGRTAASFVVGGANEDETLTPLRLGGDMREDVSAALHGDLERA